MFQLFRLLRIIFVLLRYRIDNLIKLNTLPFLLRFFFKIGPWRLIKIKQPRAIRFRLVLEKLGPIFVKFGQILSTRLDLIPKDFAEELVKLQDNVPAFNSDKAIEKIELSLQQKISDVFLSFEKKPLASASVAQVHAATLYDGSEVIVKVIRPNIEKTIRLDMGILYLLASFLTKISVDCKRLRLTEVVSDYKRTTLDELDLMREAANASQLRRNFYNSKDIYIPKIYWDHCSKNIMVMERVYGVPVTDIKTLKAKKVNIKKLANRAITVFFTQVFRDGFFHADMHPGNIWVDTSVPDDPTFISLDFGIMGTLNTDDQSYLARNVLAFFHQDYRKVAELHIISGWVDEKTPINELESAIRTVCEPIFDRPLDQISFGHVLINLFRTARRFNMEVQPQLILLEKTLINVEGIGKQLYPELNLWDTAKPFLENWLIKRVSPKGIIKRIHQNFPDWIEQAPIFSRKVLNAIKPDDKSNINTGLINIKNLSITAVLMSIIYLYQPEIFFIPKPFALLVAIMGIIIIGNTKK